MKRPHVHVTVADLEPNIRFGSSVFGSQPTVREVDGAKVAFVRRRVDAQVKRDL